MPDTPISAITYPASSNAPNVPSDMQAMVSDMDTILIPKFASAAARASAITSPIDGEHYWQNDTHRLYVYRDSYSAWHPYSLSSLKVKTNSETVTSSTVLQDDDHIVNLPFKANTSYFLRGFLICQSPAAADIKLVVAASQTPQAGIWATKISVGGPGVQGMATAFGTSQNLATQGSVVDFITIEGYILTHASNSGTLKLQWAQNTSDPGNTQMHSGSHIELVEA